MIDIERYRVVPGTPLRLGARDPADTQGATREAAEAETAALGVRLDALQERLYAEGRQSLLLVLQAMDGAGKDSTIRRVLGPLNPQGVRVASFKVPTARERAHDFLWRVHAQVPQTGEIGVFNRSHYEDVLVVRVRGLAPPEAVEGRYAHIRHFEALLSDAGTRVVKVMLHISKAYQLARMRRRLEDPTKWWKFNPGDLEDRRLWDDYQRAYEIALERTSTDRAPWYVVPAENRWFRDLVVARLLATTLEAMNPQYPEPTFDPDDFPPDALE
ncbi:MAG: PPK2 family polyphosphate kinase [Rubricoccaceae bacterium]